MSSLARRAAGCEVRPVLDLASLLIAAVLSDGRLPLDTPELGRGPRVPAGAIRSTRLAVV